VFIEEVYSPEELRRMARSAKIGELKEILNHLSSFFSRFPEYKIEFNIKGNHVYIKFIGPGSQPYIVTLPNFRGNAHTLLDPIIREYTKIYSTLQTQQHPNVGDNSQGTLQTQQHPNVGDEIPLHPHVHGYGPGEKGKIIGILKRDTGTFYSIETRYGKITLPEDYVLRIYNSNR
jgi:hypothetical protein